MEVAPMLLPPHQRAAYIKTPPDTTALVPSHSLSAYCSLLAPLSVASGSSLEPPTAIPSKTKDRNWLWLMAATTAIGWWVVSAFTEPLSNASTNADDDEKLFAISFWILFFTLYAAKSYRFVRQGHQLILSSLLGSILIIVLLAAYCEHLTDDRRFRGKGMQGFAVQGLAVGPFCLTIWVPLVVTVLQGIESLPQRGVKGGAAAGSAPV